MMITFYNTNDTPNVLNKTLEYVNGFDNLPLKKDMDILNPVFEMTFNTDYAQKINYMYIDDFKRYYFTKCELMTGGRVKIIGQVDVLMSWGGDILKQNAILTRQNVGNNFIRDTETIMNEKPIVFTRKFPNDYFNTNSMVLLVTGG